MGLAPRLEEVPPAVHAAAHARGRGVADGVGCHQTPMHVGGHGCLRVMSYDRVFPLQRIETTLNGEGYKDVLRRFLDNHYPAASSSRSTIGRRAPQGGSQPFTFLPGY